MMTDDSRRAPMAIRGINLGGDDQVHFQLLLNLLGDGSGGGLGHAAGPPPATRVPTAAASAEGERRAGRPASRRRPRARRPPTTVLNTDAVNFRSMVQQFTGAQQAPFPAAASGGAGHAAPRFTQLRRQQHAAFPFGSQLQQERLLHQGEEEEQRFPPAGNVYGRTAAGNEPLPRPRGYNASTSSDGFPLESVSLPPSAQTGSRQDGRIAGGRLL